MLKHVILALCGLLLPAVVTAVQAETVRPAAVAGFWYPGDKARLGAYVDGLLNGEDHAGGSQGQVRALIAPHAGYRYSGAVAGAAYRLLRGHKFNRVLLLGPSHHGSFHGLSIAAVTHYETPLGRIPLDLDAVRQLRASDLVTADPAAHREEHSLEMQLPLLQRALQPGWQLVPVLVGQLLPEDYPAAAELLRPLLDDNTLVVVSSDFTHYGPRFGYLPFPDDADTPARLEALDSGSLGYILDKNPQGFLDYKKRTGTTICGYQPVALLLHLLPADSEGELVTYATSGQLTGDFGNSVSYMSIVFRTPGNDASMPDPADSVELSDSDMQLLHKLASAAVEIAARPRDDATMQYLLQLEKDIPPALEEPAGVFVTLMKSGQLRGCIGSGRPVYPLYQAVVTSAIQAASSDHRYTPVQPDELEGMDIEVSVMTRPVSVDSYLDFVLGEDGIILEKDGHTALFLPEVPVKYNWNREQLLNQLAMKAGLPGVAWKEGASFKVFRTRKFSAPYEVAAHPGCCLQDFPAY
jgi:AmmeMemoRadiSam system protein B/AmmeMemoRadiSam system protein A